MHMVVSSVKNNQLPILSSNMDKKTLIIMHLISMLIMPSLLMHTNLL